MPEQRLTFAQATRLAQRQYLTEVLSEAGGNISRAAKIAGVERTNLYRVLRYVGLRMPSTGAPKPRRKTLRQVERDARVKHLRRAVVAAGGNITKAAELAGVNRTHMYKALRGLGVSGRPVNRGNEAWRALGAS